MTPNLNSDQSKLARHGRGPGLVASEISRRHFLRLSGKLAVGMAAVPAFFKVNEARAESFGNPVLVETDASVEVKYSVCQGCHGRCGIKCKIVNGVLVKIDGNPYHPCNLDQHLSFSTDPAVAKTTPAKLCAKGLGGMQSLYDPYRLKDPLKRVGPRGSGEWEVITWAQAFDEIGAKMSLYRDSVNYVNPAAQELGKKVNQIVFSGGRNQQSAFTDMFWKNIVGTINARHDHTSICEVSHHIAHELFTGWGDAAPFLTSGYKNHTKPDLAQATFVLWFGSDPCSAAFTFVPIARKLIDFVGRGGKLYVVDPRCNVAASKGTWIPIKTGVDAAMAMAIGRHIVDSNLHKTAFLSRPHNGAANPTGELNVTDATLLVKLDPVSGRPSAFLRATEAGIAGAATDFVVWSGGAAVKFDTVNTADLLPGAKVVNGITCKTAFQLYVERVREKTLAQWSAICGVPVATIQKLGNELAAAGRKGCVTMYRGSVQHTNGTYTGLAVLYLNLLVGNFNWKGGLSFGGGGWSASVTDTVPGGVSESGAYITRLKKKYEETTEYAQKVLLLGNGYPAKRPWFPLAGHYNFQEIMPSIEDEYPYPVKVLFMYWNGIPYSTPGARAVYERVLSNMVGGEYKVPLVVVVDIAMGEATAWADYVLPDTTYLERWTAASGVTPTTITRVNWIRQPVVGTIAPNGDYTGVLPNTKTLEDILIGIGSKIAGAPAVPWANAKTYWDRHFVKIAAASPAVTVNDVLARGGRFENYDQAYDGEKLRWRFENRLYFFSEKLATKHDPMTGQWFDGLGKYEPIADVMGNPIAVTDAAYPLELITYKIAWHSQMHTIRYPWLVSLQPENFIEMNPADATSRGLRTGDRARVTSASSPVEGAIGLVRVTSTVCPGVVAVSHHFGHWEMSSRPAKVDGAFTPDDPSRGAGINVNPIMRLDPALPNVTLQDKVGASASFYDTRVKVTKV